MISSQKTGIHVAFRKKEVCLVHNKQDVRLAQEDFFLFVQEKHIPLVPEEELLRVQEEQFLLVQDEHRLLVHFFCTRRQNTQNVYDT